MFELIEETWVKRKDEFGERVIYFAIGQEVVKIASAQSLTLGELAIDHEEEDSKIAFLVQHAITNYADIEEVCVRSCSGDVDIPVILIGSFGTVEDKIIFVDYGSGKPRKKIRIDSSGLAYLEQQALVGFHAFSGNDYLSSFFRKTQKIWK